jgi:hypothetical protein
METQKLYDVRKNHFGKTTVASAGTCQPQSLNNMDPECKFLRIPPAELGNRLGDHHR